MHYNEIYQNDIAAAAESDLAWEELTDKTFLITGATGMIASVIIDILMKRNEKYKQNIQINAVSRNAKKAAERFAAYRKSPYFSHISHDVTAPLPELGGMDYILHAASNTHPRAYAQDPIGTITANVQGTYNLLEYAAAHRCKRFLFFSSVEIYGENRGDAELFDESYMGYIDCNTLRAGYPESKRLGEALCNAFAADRNQDFIIGRFSRVYGPTMSEDDSKAIAQFIKKAAAGEDIVLKSEGNQLYSYTYAVDAAAAALYLLLKGEGKSAVNITDARSVITLRDLAEVAAGEAGTKVIFELPDRAEQTGYSTATKAVLDGAKIESLGWRASTRIEEGMQKTIKIRRQNGV